MPQHMGAMLKTINAAAFAPEALRRASPKLGNHAERRRETAEHEEQFLMLWNATAKARRHEEN